MDRVEMIEVSPKIETKQIKPLVFDFYGISALYAIYWYS